MEPEVSLPCSQVAAKYEALCNIVTIFFLRRGVVSPSHNPQTGGPPLDCCSRLLIQYIRRYPSYLESVLSLRISRMRHAAVTWIHITWKRPLGKIN